MEQARGLGAAPHPPPPDGDFSFRLHLCGGREQKRTAPCRGTDPICLPMGSTDRWMFGTALTGPMLLEASLPRASSSEQASCGHPNVTLPQSVPLGEPCCGISRDKEVGSGPSPLSEQKVCVGPPHCCPRLRPTSSEPASPRRAQTRQHRPHHTGSTAAVLLATLSSSRPQGS